MDTAPSGLLLSLMFPSGESPGEPLAIFPFVIIFGALVRCGLFGGWRGGLGGSLGGVGFFVVFCFLIKGIF